MSGGDVYAQLSGDVCTQVCSLLCMWGGARTPRWLCAMWLCAPGSCLSICVCDWHVVVSTFVHLCVSMWSRVNIIWIVFCLFYLTTCSGGWCVCICMCVCCVCVCMPASAGGVGPAGSPGCPSIIVCLSPSDGSICPH